jgi:hypothetical protein
MKITRRDAIKKALYTAPLILTLKVTPSFASNGSGEPQRRVRQDGDQDHSAAIGTGVGLIILVLLGWFFL